MHAHYITNILLLIPLISFNAFNINSKKYRPYSSCLSSKYHTINNTNKSKSFQILVILYATSDMLLFSLEPSSPTPLVFFFESQKSAICKVFQNGLYKLYVPTDLFSASLALFLQGVHSPNLPFFPNSYAHSLLCFEFTSFSSYFYQKYSHISDSLKL